MLSNLNEPHDVEILIRPELAQGEPTGSFQLTLLDRMRSGVFRTAVVRFDFDAEPLPGLSQTAGRFVELFHRDDNEGMRDGLAFGRFLRQRLLPAGEVGELWREIEAAREQQGRPLRLEIGLPSWAETRLSELPIELLADDHGFLFRRPGHVLVRMVAGLSGLEHRMKHGARAMLAWANPRVPGAQGGWRKIPSTVFEHHEQALAELGGRLGLGISPACGVASLRGLREHLEQHAPVELVSLIVHGDERGGKVLLHREDADYPEDEGEQVDAADLARELRKAGVKVALLWSCHGGRHHAVSGAVAQQMLIEQGGDLAVVVASHAALRADMTVRVAHELLRALGGVAGGDFERALTEARCALAGEDLQWAAPVYYARPLHGRSARIVVDEETPAPAPARAPGAAPELEEAPQLTVHFRGREDTVVRGLELLRRHRLLSVVGLPGIGKTEVALAVAGRALAAGGLGLERALWLSLAGRGEVEGLRAGMALRFGLERCEDDETLARAIGEQAMLLVLDNAEDLARVAGPRLRALLETLLRMCKRLRVLASSRRLLGSVAGVEEQVLEIPRLEPPADLEVFEAVAAPRLGSAELASPELAALAAMLEGHPRSLVLVAGQAGRGLSLAALRRRLERDKVEAVVAAELLGEDLAATPDNLLRAERVVSSLNLAWEPLAATHPEAARLFSWLGVLPAGLPAVLVPLAFGEEGEEHLYVLQANHLVEIRGRDQRMGLPAPIRWYAARRHRELPEAERWQWLGSTLAAIGGWLEAAYRDAGTKRSRRAYERAFTEEPNVVAVLGMCQEGAADVGAVAPGLAAVLERWLPLMGLAGRPGRALEIADRAREVITDWPAAQPTANTLQALGDLYVRTDRLREAESAYSQALPIYREIEARLGEANTLRALGDLYVRTARLREAESAYSQALPIYREIEARLGEANTLQGLAGLELAQGAPAKAFASYLGALELQQGVEDRLGEAGSHGYLARTARTAGNLPRAVALGAKARSLLRDIDERFGRVLALNDLVQCFLALEDAEGLNAAIFLSWHLGRQIEHPSAEQWAQVLPQLIEGFDAEQEPSRDQLLAFERLLEAAVARCEAQLAERGEGLYDPLEASAE